MTRAMLGLFIGLGVIYVISSERSCLCCGGVDGSVLSAPEGFLFVAAALLCGGRHVGVLELLPDDVDGEVGGVAHVAGVEPVVAQLVEEYLVGGEVGGGRAVVCMVADKGVGSKEQRAFAELVLMKAVGQMADGTDGEYELTLELMQAREEGLPGVDYLGYGEQLAVE